MVGDRDHSLKLRRAGAHLQQLNRWADGWIKEHEQAVTGKADPDRGGKFVVTAWARKPPADPISLIIGECLHNLRSALDLLAYELASAYTKKPLPQDIGDSSEFPIIGDVNSKGASGAGFNIWTSKAVPRIRGIDPKALAIIKGLQPYKWGTPGFERHPLWILHELDRINKHRLLHPAAAVSQGFGLKIVPGVANAAIQPGTIESLAVEVREEPTEIAVLPPIRPANPSREMHVDFASAPTLAFGKDVPLVALESVIDVLSGSYNFVMTDVLPPLEPFLA